MVNNEGNICSLPRLRATCTYGCSPNGCLLPQPIGNIQVNPSLLHESETTTVTWETTDMQAGSCTVSENNPEINDTRTGPDGTFVSSPIRMQTRYNLNCTDLNGQPFSDFDVVNVIPIFEEE